MIYFLHLLICSPSDRRSKLQSWLWLSCSISVESPANSKMPGSTSFLLLSSAGLSVFIHTSRPTLHARFRLWLWTSLRKLAEKTRAWSLIVNSPYSTTKCLFILSILNIPHPQKLTKPFHSQSTKLNQLLLRPLASNSTFLVFKMNNHNQLFHYYHS